jgi:hypothetical protein
MRLPLAAERRGQRLARIRGAADRQGSVRNDIEEASGRGQAQIKKGKASEGERFGAGYSRRAGGEKAKAGRVCKQRGSEESRRASIICREGLGAQDAIARERRG